MNVKRLCYAGALAVLVCLQSVGDVRCQEAGFELPVQLVGFPVIILAVRLSNFVKKLAYSLNPGTYRSRNRRALPGTTELDVLEAEKRVVSALGTGACIYARTCVQHAERKAAARHQPMDWFDLLRCKYEPPAQTTMDSKKQLINDRQLSPNQKSHSFRNCKSNATPPGSQVAKSHSLKSERDVKILTTTPASSPSCSKDSLDLKPGTHQRRISEDSKQDECETFERQDSRPSLSAESANSTSPKVSRKYFTNWKQACGKTKDKTKDLLKRWRTLPESECLQQPPRGMTQRESKDGDSNSSHGWSVHVWTTWVNRCSEDLECMELEEEEPEATLSAVQTEKLTLFFSELLDNDKDEVISDQDFDHFCEKLAHFADWSTNSSEYNMLLEVKREFIENFIEPLPAKWSEKPYYKRVCGEEGGPGQSSLESWTARWALLLTKCRRFYDLPLYLQYFCKILFSVIDNSGTGVITKQSLKSFYRSVISLNAARVEEIIDTAFDRMTSNEYLILDYSTFMHCYANWLLGKNPNGPGQWVLVPPKDKLPQPPFPVDYSALNTHQNKLEPYAPDKKTNRHSVIV